MKKFIASVVLFSVLLVGGCGDSNPTGGGGGENGGGSDFTPGSQFNTKIMYGFFTDTRGGKNQTYHTVVINGKTWFAENLNYAGVNGDIGVCYDNKADNCTKYGRLYNWAEAMDIDSKYNNELWGGSDIDHQGICPEGWRLANNADWNNLVFTAGGDTTRSPDGGTGKLKSKIGWESAWNAVLGQEYSGNGTDDYGFSALPSGFSTVGLFGNIGYNGYWWSNREINATGAWNRIMRNHHGEVTYSLSDKVDNFSVRCVQ